MKPAFGLLLGTVAAPLAPLACAETCDVLIRHGRVVDGAVEASA